MNVTRLTSINRKNSLQEAVKTRSNWSFTFEWRNSTLLLTYQYPNSEKSYSVASITSKNNSSHLETSFLNDVWESNTYSNKQDFISFLSVLLEKLGFKETASIDHESDFEIALTGEHFDDLETTITSM